MSYHSFINLNDIRKGFLLLGTKFRFITELGHKTK